MIKRKNNVLSEALAKEFDLNPGAPVKFMSRKYGMVDLNKISVEKAREMAPHLNGKLILKNKQAEKKEETPVKK